MKIGWGLEEKEFEKWKNIITIGSFDGIHRGHSIILKNLLKLATKYGGKSIVITFDPLPKEFLKKNNFQVITTLEEKLKILQENGIDGVCIIPFTEDFSKIEPYNFLKKIWKHFRPYAISVGYTHHFGKDGSGGVSLLEEFSKEKGIDLLEVEDVKVDDMTVSSSRIRDFISQGEITKANDMLGREFFFSATVNRGQGIGKTLSYPTANLKINSLKKILPKEGVYAAKVLLNFRNFGAMLYLGKRPTFYEDSRSTCEVYIMGFKGNLYDKQLLVKVVDRIREERKFRSAQNLRSQIMNDEETARKIINSLVSKQGG